MTTLSVVIPALNEESGIQDVMSRVLSMRADLPSAGIDDLELIVVDDGSTDRTPEIVASTDGVRLIRHQCNRGYGAALKSGFAAARGEWIGFLDADGTYPPECFPALCRAGVAQNADIVIGSRMAGADSEMPAVRRVGNLLFANLVSLLSARRITDSASGMRVFKKAVLERVYPLPDGLNLTPVMSTRALHEGLAMVEVPIPYSERQGRSKLNAVRDGMRFAHSIVWTALSYNPVRQLGMIGLVCIAVALLVGGWIAALRLQGVTTLGPWGVFALFAGAVLGVVGVSLFILGAMFNYLVAIFYQRPIRQGLFGKPIFRTPLDRRFWWMGLTAVGAGVGLGVASLALGLNGWPMARLWLWQLLGAMSILVGVQLVIGWFIMRVLEELSRRSIQIAGDMRDFAGEQPVENPAIAVERSPEVSYVRTRAESRADV